MARYHHTSNFLRTYECRVSLHRRDVDRKESCRRDPSGPTLPSNQDCWACFWSPVPSILVQESETRVSPQPCGSTLTPCSEPPAKLLRTPKMCMCGIIQSQPQTSTPRAPSPSTKARRNHAGPRADAARAIETPFSRCALSLSHQIQMYSSVRWVLNRGAVAPPSASLFRRRLVRTATTSGDRRMGELTAERASSPYRESTATACDAGRPVQLQPDTQEHEFPRTPCASSSQDLIAVDFCGLKSISTGGSVSTERMRGRAIAPRAKKGTHPAPERKKHSHAHSIADVLIDGDAFTCTDTNAIARQQRQTVNATHRRRQLLKSALSLCSFPAARH